MELYQVLVHAASHDPVGLWQYVGCTWRCWSGPCCGANGTCPHTEPAGAPLCSKTGDHLLAWAGGRADREGPGKDEGMGRRVDRPPTSFPRCCAERLSLRVYTFPQTEISRQTPGAESSEKPPAGCITRTPLVVKPSISPSGVRHLAARSWDHTWDQITSLSGPQQASSRECCPCTLEPRGGPERTGIGIV